jgi:formylglycine-generating enzyme required for sulfatase activity
MVLVKGGSFTMGCTSEQGDCDSNEKPTHEVTLGDFYMGKYEVTVKEYLAFCSATGGNWPEWLEEGSDYNVETGSDDWYKGLGYSRAGGGNLPIVGVSWHDAVAYCEWKSLEEGRPHRLPTEAEWEYAARGGVHQEGFKYSGSDNIDEVAWYQENSYDKGSGHPDYGTHEVGTKKPNALGIYDLSGNVWEWCGDWYGDYGSGSQTDPNGPSTGSGRVFRGGSWFDHPGGCRGAFRNNHRPGLRNDYLGFRVVSSPVRQ